MLVETVTWNPDAGWQPALPHPDERSTLVLVFGHLPDDDQLDAGHPNPLTGHVDPFAELARTWSGHAVLGCSTAGQLVHDGLPEAPLVAVIIRFDRTVLRHHHVEVNPAGGARNAGRDLAEAMADPKLRGVFVVGDGHAVNGVLLAAGFADRLPDMALSGGLAGNGLRAESTWSLVNGVRRTGWVSAVGFVGDHIELGFGAAGGWDVLGPERLVTQSYGNVLYELDGQPALSLYRDHLGELGDDLPNAAVGFPMSIRDLDDRTVVRTVWSVNPATDSLRLGGDVPQGSVAQLLHASTDRLVEGAHQAARRAAIGHEELAIAVSCSARRRVLGDRSDEELDAALEALDPGVRLVGFYSYSSLSPADGLIDLHNQTMTITTMRERIEVSA
jgi:hypothetical protein